MGVRCRWEAWRWNHDAFRISGCSQNIRWATRLLVMSLPKMAMDAIASPFQRQNIRAPKPHQSVNLPSRINKVL